MRVDYYVHNKPHAERRSIDRLSKDAQCLIPPVIGKCALLGCRPCRRSGHDLKAMRQISLEVIERLKPDLNSEAGAAGSNLVAVR